MYFYKTSAVVISVLSILTTIVNVVHSQNSKIVWSATAEQEDVDSLRRIQPIEGLPIVAFEKKKPNDHSTELVLPTGLAQVEINDGRIWSSKTEFFSLVSHGKPIFFCPDPDSDGVCLAPKDFTEAQALQCEYEPKPFIKINFEPQNCGPNQDGSLLRFTYSFCPAKENYHFNTSQFEISMFCYLSSLRKVFYSSYVIRSPLLIADKLLVRERETEFELSRETHHWINSDFADLMDEKIKSNPSYKFQMLMSPKFLEFSAVRKAIYHYTNVDLQHKDLFELWNEIIDHIRTNAVESFHSPRLVATAVFDIPGENKNDQLANFWVQMVMDVKYKPTRGIAILMNNFITKDTNNVQHFIDTLCVEDKCAGTFTKKFTDVGGHVRCCPITSQITELFHEGKIKPTEEVLKIRNITYVEKETNKA